MSYCTNCGTQEQQGQAFCPVCGAAEGGSVATPTMAAMPPLSYDGWNSEAQVRLGLRLDPPRHARWSVAFRTLLALPLFIVAEIVGIGALFVTIGAWFAALFTGRVPDGMQRFLTNSLRLFANLLAYSYLLVPRWPGVNFHSRANEQVSVDVDHARLRRWSVFFRLLLGYPANVVNVVLTFGSFPVLALMWLWGIVVGREPRPLHRAMALVLRFQMRLQAYGCLITPTQPFRGIFGDGPEASGPRGALATISEPSAEFPDPVGATSEPSLPTRWFVDRATRVVLVVMLVIGAPLYALNFYIERPLLTRVQTLITRSIVNSSYNITVGAVSQFESSVARCSTSSYSGCVARAATAARLELAPALATLSDNALVPPDALSRMRAYESVFRSLERELRTVQLSTTASTQRTVITDQLPTTFTDFATAHHRIYVTLNR